MKDKSNIIKIILIVGIVIGVAYFLFANRYIFLGHDYYVISKNGPFTVKEQYLSNPYYYHAEGLFNLFINKNNKDGYVSQDYVIVLDKNDLSYIKVIKYPQGYYNMVGGNATITEGIVNFWGTDGSDTCPRNLFQYDINSDILRDLGEFTEDCGN